MNSVQRHSPRIALQRLTGSCADEHTVCCQNCGERRQPEEYFVTSVREILVALTSLTSTTPSGPIHDACYTAWQAITSFLFHTSPELSIQLPVGASTSSSEPQRHVSINKDVLKFPRRLPRHQGSVHRALRAVQNVWHSEAQQRPVFVSRTNCPSLLYSLGGSLTRWPSLLPPSDELSLKFVRRSLTPCVKPGVSDDRTVLAIKSISVSVVPSLSRCTPIRNRSVQGRVCTAGHLILRRRLLALAMTPSVINTALPSHTAIVIRPLNVHQKNVPIIHSRIMAVHRFVLPCRITHRITTTGQRITIRR